MYITIADIVRKKRIDLTYPIKNFNSNKEVAIVNVFSGKIKYQFTKLWTVKLGELWSKQITAGTYMRQELIDLVEGKIEITQSDEENLQ